MFMPFNVLGVWFRGLISLVLIGGAIYLLTQWYRNRETVVVEQINVPQSESVGDGVAKSPVTQERRTVVPWQFGFNQETAFLLGGVALLVWSIGGGWMLSPRFRRRRGTDEPKKEATGAGQHLRLADGSKVWVEMCGPLDGDPVILTHGWGLDGNEWYYARKALSGKYRVITWDLPGLGGSDRPSDRDWALEKLAGVLDAVIGVAGAKPVVLVGHSIGVMITLTYCKLFPHALGTRVRGLVLAHGTYTNPVKTTAKAGLYSALQKPLLEPLCYLMVWLAPIFRVLNWLSYLNGSAHRSTERDSFSGQETRGQLDCITRLYCKSAPDVVGRGMLAMMRYDATEVLRRVTVPTLIVTGDSDSTCLPDASRHMAQTIPGAHLIVLNKAKHCGLFEHHERFDETLIDFLASPDRLGRSAERRFAVAPATPALP